MKHLLRCISAKQCIINEGKERRELKIVHVTSGVNMFDEFRRENFVGESR